VKTCYYATTQPLGFDFKFCREEISYQPQILGAFNQTVDDETWLAWMVAKGLLQQYLVQETWCLQNPSSICQGFHGAVLDQPHVRPLCTPPEPVLMCGRQQKIRPRSRRDWAVARPSHLAMGVSLSIAFSTLLPTPVHIFHLLRATP